MRGERVTRIASYALSRWEAYAIVGLVFVAVVVAMLGGWPGWVILASVVGGALLLVLLVIDSLANPEAEREASVADVEVARLRDPALRAKLRRALEYVRAYQRLAKQQAPESPDSVDEELPQLEQAVRSMYQMGLRLQEFRADRLIQRDLAELRERRSRRGPLTEDQEAQLDALQRLDDLIRAAEQGIDSALADLGRSYAELQAIRATPEFRGRALEALHQLRESTRRLSDLADGYDEVFAGRAKPRGPQRQG